MNKNIKKNMYYTKERPLRVFEAFAGYGSQLLALRRLERDFPGQIKVVPVGFSEIDPSAIKAYKALHGDVRNYGDISKINWEDVPDFDLFTMSSPCFVAGTLILTDGGYKPIEEVKVGDYVLTHTNTFKCVTNVGQRPYAGQMVKIYGMGTDIIYCTEEHPFYVRRMYKKGHECKRCFHEPEWIKAKNLDKNCYLGYAINSKSELPKWGGVIATRWKKVENKISPLFENPSFWYLMGRYVGDGWKRESPTGNSVIICCSDRNRVSLYKAINDCGMHGSGVQERTVEKVFISSSELFAFVERYGYYAYGKKVDAETINLPTPLLKSFLDGYIDSDGCLCGNLYKTTSVSRELCFGIAQCVAKVYRRPFSIYRTARPPQTVIEGRIVNQKDSYNVTWKTNSDKQDKAFYEDGYIWYPLSKLPIIQSDCVTVFNMSVDEDESYTANGAIVHNCQDFSQAGLMKGGEEGSGTRSSLLWECSRAIEAKRPQYIFFENVASLVGRKFIKGFHLWQERLEGFGYKNFANVLDATDYGVAQHRERIYMVSILRTEENPEPMYFFPKPFPLVKRMKDYLETNVDEKYYISDKVLEEFQIEKEEDGSDADCAGCGEGTDGRGAFTQTSLW